MRIYAGLRGAPNATRLALIGLGDPAFTASVHGKATARLLTMTREEDPEVTGVPTWYAACDRNGSPIYYGQVNGENADMVLNRPTIEKHGPVFLTEWVLSLPVER